MCNKLVSIEHEEQKTANKTGFSFLWRCPLVAVSPGYYAKNVL